MHRDDFRKIVSDSVAQSLAQGGTGAPPAIPADQLQTIIDGIADGVFVGLEATLEDDGVPNSINLRMPGAAEAAGKAASAAAAAATQAILTGQVPPTVQGSPIASTQPFGLPPVNQPVQQPIQPLMQQPVAQPVPPSAYQPAAVTPAGIPATPSARLTSNTSPNVKPPVPPQGAVAAAVAPVGGSTGERLLWRGRPYLMIGINYELTTQRLRIIRGIAGQTIEEIELVRVRDTSARQTLVERLFDIGDVEIISTDARQPTKQLFNIKDPVEVRELIRKAVVDERARRGVYMREEMRGTEEMHNMDDTVEAF